jgi:hypothetical protein
VQGESLRRALPYLLFFAGMLLAIGVGYAWFAPDRTPETKPSVPAPAATTQPAPPSATSPPAATHAVAPSQTLQLERAAFPASGPVRVSLELPEMSADGEPRPVRLISQPDHRILEIPGALDSGRTAATIEVDPGYLQPGTYLVEVKTTEQSHFPLRRYFIVVR